MPVARSWFKVPTAVLVAEGRETLSRMRDPANAALVERLTVVGVEPVRASFELEDAVSALVVDRAHQTQSKDELASERAAAARLAEAGFRWIRRLHARARLAAESGADPEGRFPARFRYNHPPRPRVRGVTLTLRMLAPEAAAAFGVLREHGVDQAFIDEGKGALRALEEQAIRVQAAQGGQKAATAAVRAREAAVAAVLRRVAAADEAAALEEPGTPRLITLDLLRADVARQRSATAARRRARAEDGVA